MRRYERPLSSKQRGQKSSSINPARACACSVCGNTSLSFPCILHPGPLLDGYTLVYPCTRAEREKERERERKREGESERERERESKRERETHIHTRTPTPPTPYTRYHFGVEGETVGVLP